MTKIKFKKLKLPYFMAALGVLAMALIFQSCTQNSGNNTAQGISALFSQEAEGGKSSFPYHMKFDQLAYMSCQVQDPLSAASQGHFFTFKLGAYGLSSGVALNSTFFSEQSDKNLSERAEALNEHAYSVQMAMRLKSNLAAAWAGGNSASASSYKTYKDIMVSLDEPGVVHDLLFTRSDRDFKNYFPFVDSQYSNKRRFEGSLLLPPASVESLGTDPLYVAATYRPLLISEEDAITDEEWNQMAGYQEPTSVADAVARGLGFEFSLGKGHGLDYRGEGSFSSFAGGKSRVLTSVKEKNLLDPSESESWECPSRLRFMIVRAEDLATAGNPQGAVHCGAKSDSNLVGSGEDSLSYAQGFFENVKEGASTLSYQDYQIVRNILSEDVWYIDFKNRCIVPKLTSDGDVCYSGETNLPGPDLPINYYAGSDGVTSNRCGSSTSEGLCPHYVSICFQKP